jgi:hypothetical protein
MQVMRQAYLKQRDTYGGPQDPRDMFDGSEDIKGGGGIETIGHSIHELHHARWKHHFSNSHTFLLSATDTTECSISNDCVGTVSESKDLENIVNLQIKQGTRAHQS